MSLPPTQNLAADLEQSAAIKAEMIKLLRALEQTATGHAIEKPGGWRHHTAAWAAQHQPPNPT